MLDFGREEIRAGELSEPISHYTDAVRWRDMLFISGIAPVEREGMVVGPDDPAIQARCILENMGRVLALSGASFEDVLKVTVYLTDIDDRALIDPVRKEFFGDTRPASTLIEVSALAIEGMKVEIDAVAAVPGGRDGSD
jgi:enamine deaminase RidA (YjgF/YER057c/UK114 family)